MTFHIDMDIARRNAESLVEALDGAKHEIEEQRLRLVDKEKALDHMRGCLREHAEEANAMRLDRDTAQRQLVEANAELVTERAAHAEAKAEVTKHVGRCAKMEALLREAPEPEDVHDCYGSGFTCMGGRKASTEYHDWLKQRDALLSAPAEGKASEPTKRCAACKHNIARDTPYDVCLNCAASGVKAKHDNTCVSGETGYCSCGADERAGGESKPVPLSAMAAKSWFLWRPNDDTPKQVIEHIEVDGVAKTRFVYHSPVSGKGLGLCLSADEVLTVDAKPQPSEHHPRCATRMPSDWRDGECDCESQKRIDAAQGPRRSLSTTTAKSLSSYVSAPANSETTTPPAERPSDAEWEDFCQSVATHVDENDAAQLWQMLAYVKSLEVRLGIT